MNIMTAGEPDIPELYRLQLLAFESEAAMIGSRDVPALQETEDDFQRDFAHWTTLKLVTDEDVIVGVIRYRHDGDIVDVGRLMTHSRLPSPRDWQKNSWKPLIQSVPERRESYILVRKAGPISGSTKKWVIDRLRK